MKQIRQGDILLVAVDKALPKGLGPKSEVILAEGELTGHAHTLVAAGVYDWSEAGQRYIRVSGGPGSISHQEHDPKPAAVVPENVTYRVVRQSEWNLQDQWQKVKD